MAKEAKVRFTADNQQLKKSVKDSKKEVGGFSKVVKSAGKALIGAFAVKSIISGIKNLATELGNTADRLLDLEQITGLSTDKLQEYEHVARVAGVSSEFYSRSVEGLTRRLARGSEMSASLAQGFETLGISMHDSAGNLRNGSEVTEDVISQLAEMEDVTKRNVIGAQIFSGAWKDLAPVLALGADGIEAAKKEARELGLVMDKDTLESANELRIEMETLAASSKQLGNDIMILLLPALKSIVGLSRTATSGLRDVASAASSVISSENISGWEKFLFFARSVSSPLSASGKNMQMLVKASMDMRSENEKSLDYIKERAKLREKILKKEAESTDSAELQRQQEQERLNSLGQIGRLQEQIKQAELNYIAANSDASRAAALQEIQYLTKQLELLEAKARVQAQGTQGTPAPAMMPSLGAPTLDTGNKPELQFEKVGEAAQNAQEKVNSLQEAMVNWEQVGVNAAMQVGGALMEIAGDSDRSTSEILKNMLKQIIGMLAQQIIATVPFPANIPLAAGAGAIASGLIPGFATGGDIPAGFPNDTFVAGLSSGEKVLNPSETAAYNEYIRGGSGISGSGKVEFRISGQDLYGTLKRYTNRTQENA